MYITAHAVMRYIERVERISEDAAIAALSSPIIARACAFGARYVKLGTGQRVVIVDGSVITVLPRDHMPRKMSMAYERRRDGLQRVGDHSGYYGGAAWSDGLL